MLKNYLKIAVRNLIRNKTFSLINISGLAIGMASCMFILLYANYENSYDSHHEKADNIYRVIFDRYNNNEFTFTSAPNFPKTAPALLEEYPEIINYARIYPLDGTVIKGNTKYIEEKMYYAEESFFDIFTFKFINGDRSSVLKDPLSVVLTASAAKKYFGDEDPLGKIIRLNAGSFFGIDDFKITGILEDVPENSHYYFNFLFSLNYFLNKQEQNIQNGGWGWYDWYTYIETSPGTNYKELEQKLPEFVENHKGEVLKANNSREVFRLQPIKDIHLNSNIGWEIGVNGNARTVFVLTIIAYAILIIAFVNFINLSTARSQDRSKEVGVRKVLGAHKYMLVKQFLWEAILMNLVPVIIAFIIIKVVSPFFVELTGKNLSTSFSNNTNLYIGILTLFIIGAFLSAIYPALFLSSFKPVTAIKGVLSASRFSFISRKGLIILQFAVSVFLIGSTLAILDQLNFMMKQDIGIDLEQKIVLNTPSRNASIDPDSYNGYLSSFKEELLSESNITGFTASSTIPGKENRGISSYNAEGMEPNNRVNAYRNRIDYDYIPVYNIQIAAGRNFSKDFRTDTSAVLINETASSAFGYATPEEAIDKIVSPRGRRWRIVGVLKDYNQLSLKRKVDPNIYFLSNLRLNYFTINFKTADTKDILNIINARWNEKFSSSPLEYLFLDDFYALQYESDERLSKIFSLFSSLAIFIACLGLFGLSTFAIEKRIKEIGVRKVLGASVANIMKLMSIEFLVLVVASNIIAWPLIYFALNKWLEDFAYRIDIGISIFISAAIMAVLIAAATISYQAYRAANVDPVKSLRYE